jgi:WhiB family redox-sensing transcriptional regulator
MTRSVDTLREPVQRRTAFDRVAPHLGIEPPEWMFVGACASVLDDELWFPPKGGTTRTAKAVCGRCPVQAECLQYALDRNERHGIWGGRSERERRQMNRSEA